MFAGARPGGWRIDGGKATAARRYRSRINSAALLRPRPSPLAPCRAAPARFDAPLTLPTSTCPIVTPYVASTYSTQ